MKGNFDELVNQNLEDIIRILEKLIKFKSVSNETGNEVNPFGEECTNVLNYILDLAGKWGFRTKNLDNYCGYIEFGKGEELVGIIGHLDVVPANIDDGWSTDPFIAVKKDNKIYGRGSIDDKGPVTATLYAMKLIKDSGIKLNKRVRLILGLNEEKSWKCIEHYKKIGEEIPSVGFSPDADFPCIYAEKGILSVKINNKFLINGYEIENIDCKNNALNVVPKYCSITLKCTDLNKKINFEKEENIEIEYLENETVKVIAKGIASHAAHPEMGRNAITRLVEYLIKYEKNINTSILNKLYEKGIFSINSPKFLSKEVIKDESGILTSNIGFLGYDDENIEVGINLRIPVNTELDYIKEKYMELKNEFEDMNVEFTSLQQPLYVEKSSKLVTTLTNIFNEKTGMKEEPIAIGGGTYARAFKNLVAFGATMPGQKDMCHQVDEFIDINTLILSTKIYAEAIYQLAK